MKQQLIFRLSGAKWKNHLAILTELEDGKCHVRYFYKDMDMSNDYLMTTEDHEFVPNVFYDIRNYCKEHDLHLWSY